MRFVHLCLLTFLYRLPEIMLLRDTTSENFQVRNRIENVLSIDYAILVPRSSLSNFHLVLLMK